MGRFTHAAGLVPRAMFSLLRCLFDFKASLTLSKLYVGGMGIGRWEIGDSTFHAHPEFQELGRKLVPFAHAPCRSSSMANAIGRPPRPRMRHEHSASPMRQPLLQPPSSSE